VQKNIQQCTSLLLYGVRANPALRVVFYGQLNTCNNSSKLIINNF